LESYETATEMAPVLATLYGKLDYQHGFADGNSRTLRVFTQQLVSEKSKLHSVGATPT